MNRSRCSSHDRRGSIQVLVDAAAGDWKYTVTAIKLPNENFPFTVTVGQK